MSTATISSPASPVVLARRKSQPTMDPLVQQTLRKLLTKKGLILSEDESRLIIVGRKEDGTQFDVAPLLEIIALNGNEPVYQTVAKDDHGNYRPFNGVHFTE